MSSTILILEDSRVFAKLMVESLRQAGLVFEHRVILTRAEFVAALSAGGFDLILADQQLPDFSGTEALQLCFAHDVEVPFIFVTGTLGEDATVELMRQGATDCVFKDRISRLVPAVLRALAERAQAQDAQRSRKALSMVTSELRAIGAMTAAFLEKGGWLDVAGLLVENARTLTGSPVGLVAVVGDGGAVRVDAHHGIAWDPTLLAGPNGPFELAGHDHLPGEIIRRGSALRVRPEDPEHGAWRLPADGAFGGWLGIPLRKGATVLGAIVVANRREPYDAADEAKLELLAQSASVIYDSQRRLDREAELSEQLRHSQKMEAVGRLAGGVAHDFNNLLTVILGYSQSLLATFNDVDPRRKPLDQVVKAGRQASSLTQQLLALSRKQVLQPKLIDLNSVVADTRELLGRLIGEEITVTMELDSELGTVLADRAQVEQVLMNLAVNARDAMPRGGTLTIRTANTQMDETGPQSERGDIVSRSGRYSRLTGRVRSLAAAKLKPFVSISISDTGCGMDQETLGRLFEPFFTTKEIGRGTGLGLATVYGIVKQSGGHIAVDSLPERGTTFSIYFPRASGVPAPVSRPGVPLPASGASETILVAEDEVPVREMIADGLSGRGYKVLASGSGAEALAIASEFPGTIDLLLTDVVMPQMSGAVLAQRLKSDRPGIKVLFMSGYTDDELSPHGLASAEVSLIEKPFDQDQLALRVRKALDRGAV